MDRNHNAGCVTVEHFVVRLVRACGSKQTCWASFSVSFWVRLVRACGSKQCPCWLVLCRFSVRLVRACGSKLRVRSGFQSACQGQARKSLWIETRYIRPAAAPGAGQARKSLWIETASCDQFGHKIMVRLVRACGSKHILSGPFRLSTSGQARKSLWIETANPAFASFVELGQARKSLWIETAWNVSHTVIAGGQARKSLWIETSVFRNKRHLRPVRLVRACGSKLRH